MAWFLKSASAPEEDLARCQILPPRWRRSPKKKGNMRYPVAMISRVAVHRAKIRHASEPQTDRSASTRENTSESRPLASNWWRRAAGKSSTVAGE